MIVLKTCSRCGRTPKQAITKDKWCYYYCDYNHLSIISLPAAQDKEARRNWNEVNK